MKRALVVVVGCFALSVVGQRLSAQSSLGGPVFSPVTAERLLNAEQEPENWLTYSGQLNGQRYSRLDQINRMNAAELELRWAYQLPVLDRAETTPLVVDGVMFITEAAQQRDGSRCA